MQVIELLRSYQGALIIKALQSLPSDYVKVELKKRDRQVKVVGEKDEYPLFKVHVAHQDKHYVMNLGPLLPTSHYSQIYFDREVECQDIKETEKLFQTISLELSRELDKLSRPQES